jgi:hypothetical protein
MAKHSGSDNSGISMLALVRQVLIDGKVHTLKQISEHMQRYMFKGMPPERVQENVKLLLDHHSQVEKTTKGYRLKSGSNLLQVVRDVLSDIPLPISAKEITKLVAKKQGVPADMIRLNLDEDEKIASATYSSRKFYYLVDKKQVNEKVYKILKNKNRAMTIDEIYEALETEETCTRKNTIFLPREDKRFTKVSNKYTIKKKEKPKTKPAEPRHLVNRAELEKVIRYLDQTQNRMTAHDLAEEVLNIPLEKTNLRFKLARDPRIRRENDRFYYEVQKVDQEVPVKIKEKLGKDFFKVKARMMGSSEVHTVADLLDRVYSVNIATQDYDFYLQELEDLLMNDDETILLLDNGWVHQSNDFRSSWTPGIEFQPVQLPDPPSPLHKDKLSAAEQEFLEHDETQPPPADQNAIAVPITAVDRKYGIARYPDQVRTFFPCKPGAYEIVLDIEDEAEHYESFVIVDSQTILGLEMLYSERLPVEGGIMIFTANPDNPYRFTVRLEKSAELFNFPLDRLVALSEIAESDWTLPDLIREIFRTSKERFLSCRQVWAEVNLVRQAEKEDVLATLKDYDCFLPIKSMDGFYSFDPSLELHRLSYKEEAKEPAVPAGTERKDSPETPVETPVMEAQQEPAADTEAVSAAKTPSKTKAKQKAKKETPRKRRKEIETPPEELPDHLLKLKGFERKLPKLKPAAPATPAATPSTTPRRPPRIGAVSTERSIRARIKSPVKTGTTDDMPLLVDIPPMPKEPQQWDTTSFVNPQRGKGYAELQTALEVLKAFVSRVPEVRRKDGSIVVFLDKNDIAVYFRIPPENQECWLAWIPEKSLDTIRDKDIWLKNDGSRAKKSDNGYWWATDKFRGPKGNYRDKNVLQGVEIVGKLLELMEQENV